MESEAVLHCGTFSGIVEPEIVFLDEAVEALDEGSSLAANSDSFLAIRSSPTVLPAAVRPQYDGEPLTFAR